jgi:Na+-transporting methylmalonyl-CoA/oxaloacetate decarboxylase gamma subunit
MGRFVFSFLLIFVAYGCSSSNVKYTKIDESYVESPKPAGAEIVFTSKKIKKPHRVIGVIEASLGRKARKVELDALMIKKAREIGADGIMLVEYDVDPTVYVTHHHNIVGHGPWKHHVVRSRKHVKIDKTANGIAVVFK